ncbi:MAG: carboxylating nicotinate-nucleotide diphosphorylase [Lentisphaeria bacterium]|nr:carboxylating nicotinate-nucleotide diphosphorylase [Lentisphaeria bacterium]
MKEIPAIDWKRVDLLIGMALEEDLGDAGDVTSSSVVPADIQARAVLRCKEEGMVMAGQEVAERVFRKLDPSCQYTVFKKDGEVCKYGDIIAEVRGKAQSLLTAERTALNFIQRLCGVATTARKYALALGDSQTVILDTRKTTPGYRNLEKYAVAVGCACNHRIGLYDRAMIKDNHRELAALEGPGSIARSVNRVREMYPGLEVEVEADRLEEVEEAADAGAEYILLDNMSNEMMAEAVKIVHGRSKLEASGGITLERLASIGQIGVDFVSSGALTHSVKSADISLDILAEENV